jgi:hypothetical protein
VTGHSTSGDVVSDSGGHSIVRKTGRGRVVAAELERARRVGLNEALFREVNEQIRSLADEFSVGEGTMETAGYDVVRKREGIPADVARETNPRL